MLPSAVMSFGSGYRQNAMPPTANAGAVNVCATCGVVGPVGATCGACGTEARAITVTRTGDLVWCAMRASIRCRSCGFPSPLEGLVVADGVDCARCGSYQQFDRSVWHEGLAFAHEVGDLGGPDPEGRFPDPEIWIANDNPYKLVGKAKALESKSAGIATIDAAPGVPLCKKCRQPLRIESRAGETLAECGTCGTSSKYAIEPQLAELGVVAIVADEHRIGRVEAKTVAGAEGAMALTCPQCGAALRATGEPTTECTYCHAFVYVPGRARASTQAAPKPVVFYAGFRGPSQRRARLEEGAGASPLEVAKKASGVLSRGLSAIPGVELAPPKPGIDFRQLLLTLSLTSFALGCGYALWSWLRS